MHRAENFEKTPVAMGKRSKKTKRLKGRRKRAPRSDSAGIAGVTGPADATRLGTWLVEALQEVRGRRAVMVAERLLGGERREDPEVIRCAAAAGELRIRELLRDGHDSQAASMVVRLRAKSPGVVEYWPLGLRCRMGIAPELRGPDEDEGVRLRLRRETWDPAELLGCPWEGTAREARWILDAWDHLDGGDDGAAEAALQNVGRRSALIDWRLFLQGQIALRRGAQDEFEANYGRVDPDSPVRPMMQALLERSRAPGEQSSPFAGVVTASSRLGPIRELADRRFPPFKADQGRRVQRAAEWLRAAGHPTLGNRLLSCYLEGAEAGDSWERPPGLGKIAPLELAEAGLRIEMNLGMDYLEDAEETLSAMMPFPSWSNREKAILLVLRCEIARNRSHHEFLPLVMGNLGNIFLPRSIHEAVMAWSRKAAKLWPELDAVYEVWDWAEEEDGRSGCEALEAWHKAFPNRPDILRRSIRARIDRGALKEVERDIAGLAALPGEAEHAADLTSRHQLRRARIALQEERRDEVDQVAESFQPRSSDECVEMAVYHWLAASNKREKAKRGRALAEAGSPWFVAATALSLNSGVTFSKLPAGVRRSLDDDPESGVPRFLEALTEVPRSMPQLIAEPGLHRRIDKLFKSVRKPEHAVDLLNATLSAYRGIMGDAFKASILAFGLTRVLLEQEEPHWIATGLAARASVMRMLCGDSFGTSSMLVPEMYELFAAARAQYKSDAEGRVVVEPYVRHAELTWRDLPEPDENPPDLDGLLARERAFHYPHQWHQYLSHSVQRREFLEDSGRSYPTFGDDGEEDEDDLYDDDEDFDDSGIVELDPLLADVRLPAYPPTTQSEAEALFDRVLRIGDMKVRGRRLDELRNLLEASPVRTSGMAQLKMFVEAAMELLS